MSDDTLKFLSLLAALFHPAPRLLCASRNRKWLHPDALQLVAEALVEASQSTQLIVTTHSEALVDALHRPLVLPRHVSTHFEDLGAGHEF